MTSHFLLSRVLLSSYMEKRHAKVSFNMKRKVFYLEKGVDRKKDMVVVISKLSGKVSMQGFVYGL